MYWNNNNNAVGTLTTNVTADQTRVMNTLRTQMTAVASGNEHAASTSADAGVDLPDVSYVLELLQDPVGQLRRALIRKHLEPNSIVTGCGLLDSCNLASLPKQHSYPLPVVAAAASPEALRLVLAAKPHGDPNVATATGINCVIAAVTTDCFMHRERQEALHVRDAPAPTFTSAGEGCCKPQLRSVGVAK